MHTILHIGAGRASELPEFLSTGAEKIVLVEPNPDLAEQLRQRTAQNPEVTVLEAAITDSLACNQLYEYNLPEASSLHPVTGLKTLFPGLKANSTHIVATLSPDQLLEKHGPQTGQRALLAVQAPGEEHAFLQTLINTDQLKKFSELHVSANLKPYYQGSVAAEKTLQALVDYGYEITVENQQDPDWPSWKLVRNPLKDQINKLQAENQRLKASTKHHEKDLNQSLQEKVEVEEKLKKKQQELTQKIENFVALQKNVEKCNSDASEGKKDYERVRSQLNEAGKNLEKISNELLEVQDRYQTSTEALTKERAAHQLTSKELEEHTQKLNNQKIQTEIVEGKTEDFLRSTEQLKKESKDYEQQTLKHKAELNELKKQCEKFKQDLSKADGTISKLTNEISNTKEELTTQQSENSKLDNLENKMLSVGSDMKNYLDKKLNNAARQIENTLSMQNYFNTGELPLSHGGWSISPDLSLFLTEKVETENYDLIIEFGSGISTALFAKVLKKKTSKQQQQECVEKDRLTNSNTKASTEWAALSNNNEACKRLLTFEHNKHYYEKTADMLRHNGLDQVVNLVHAPLVDYKYQGEDYLYYNCDLALKKLAELYESREPKILVLVDGPPGETGLNARFPALPKILNNLPNATYDFILDDYNRVEEKVVAERWIEYINKRGIDHVEQKIPLDKGAICISIGISDNKVR